MRQMMTWMTLILTGMTVTLTVMFSVTFATAFVADGPLQEHVLCCLTLNTAKPVYHTCYAHICPNASHAITDHCKLLPPPLPPLKSACHISMDMEDPFKTLATSSVTLILAFTVSVQMPRLL
jgi:hypothetical protein